ncbi:MAG: hypothetical protein IJT82_03445 [Schwartzia sp.]|nr:hypothetical protein [Schwartzia sp. (in: firmicutes)]
MTKEELRQIFLDADAKADKKLKENFIKEVRELAGEKATNWDFLSTAVIVMNTYNREYLFDVMSKLLCDSPSSQ